MTLCLARTLGNKNLVQLLTPVWQSDAKALNEAGIRKNGMVRARGGERMFSGRNRDDSLRNQRAALGGLGKPRDVRRDLGGFIKDRAGKLVPGRRPCRRQIVCGAKRTRLNSLPGLSWLMS